jgi:ArsR family transcriptional regulator
MITDSPKDFGALDRERLERWAQVLKAVAQPTRLALLESLADGEACVCDLADAVRAERSNVSRHLAVLLHAGVVRAKRRGVQIFYSLQTPCILNTIRCMVPSGEALPTPAVELGLDRVTQEGGVL